MKDAMMEADERMERRSREEETAEREAKRYRDEQEEDAAHFGMGGEGEYGGREGNDSRNGRRME